MNANAIFLNIIEVEKKKEQSLDIWRNSPYKDLIKLQSNNVGNVGEKFIQNVCKHCQIPSECDGSKTKEIGGGKGDGTILGIQIEIKTACQGSSSFTFQHELGEIPWKGSKYIIFIDISPTCIYLTVFPNFDESVYKSKEKLKSFPTKSITWRKEKGAFKLDTSLKINEQSVKTGLALKISIDTSLEEIGEFIRTVLK